MLPPIDGAPALWRLVALAMVPILAACDGLGIHRHSECPDIQGVYSLRAQDVPGGQFSLPGTFLGREILPMAHNPWLAVKIEGTPGSVLTVTYLRAAQSDSVKLGAKSTPAYVKYAMEVTADRVGSLDKQTATLARGAHYECRDGWLAAPNEHLGLRVRRNAEGDLEGYLTERTPRVISLWAETGAGIPYWIDSKRRNATWPSASLARVTGREIDPQPDFVPPRPPGGVARQEWDLTYGGGIAGASGGITRGDSPREQTFDPQRAIRSLVDRDATVERIRVEADRYVLTLRVESRGQVTRTLENLRGDTHLQDVQDHGAVSDGKATAVAMISMRVVSPR